MTKKDDTERAARSGRYSFDPERGGEHILDIGSMVFGPRGRPLGIGIGPTGFVAYYDDVPQPDPKYEDPAAKWAREEESLRPGMEKYVVRTVGAVAWDDVAGCAAAKTALLEALEAPTRHAALHAHYGRRPTRGVLLYGPPGCGKTMLARAVVASVQSAADLPAEARFMLSVSVQNIVSKYVGETEERIAAIFAYARAYAARWGRSLPVFFDEVDAILPRRSGGRAIMPWEESQVSVFLAELDGLRASGAVVLLATNRPHAIDEAVLRPGRVDARVLVPRPDADAASVLLTRALRGVPVLETAEALVRAACSLLYSPHVRVATVRHAGGKEYLTMADVVSGAMLAELVEQAKSRAIARDVSAGGAPTGLALADLRGALDALCEDQRRLLSHDALTEFVERVGVVPLSVEPWREKAVAFPDAEKYN